MKSFWRGILVLALLLPMSALGATLIAEEEVSVSSGTPVEDNLYLAGGVITVNDEVVGDLLVAGGQILVTDTVSEDLTIAGGNLTVLSDVGEDVRLAGGSILVAGSVGGDLMAAGGSLTIASDTTVGRDLVVAGGQLTVDGDVAGDAELTGGVVTLNGRVTGDVIIRADEAITIGDNAVIEGSLVYHARQADVLAVSDSANITGEVSFVPYEGGYDEGEVETMLAAIAGTFLLYKFLATLVTALVLAWLFRRFATRVAQQVVATPLPLLGLGFVTLVVTPVAALLLLFTLLGIPLALMTGISFVLLIVVTSALTSIVLGAWLSQLVYSTREVVVTWKNVIAGVVVLTLVKLVPVIGWVLGFVLFLLTLGSITRLVYHKLWQTR
jgi:cytoskeletal protein CcmA (bactofilin family)